MRLVTRSWILGVLLAMACGSSTTSSRTATSSDAVTSVDRPGVAQAPPPAAAPVAAAPAPTAGAAFMPTGSTSGVSACPNRWDLRTLPAGLVPRPAPSPVTGAPHGPGGGGNSFGGGPRPPAGCPTAPASRADGRPQAWTEMPSAAVFGPGLSEAEVNRYLQRAMPRLAYCYEHQVIDDPTLAGTVSARFTVARDGTVSSAQSDGVSPAVAGCVTEVIEHTEFRAPKGGPVLVTQDLRFAIVR